MLRISKMTDYALRLLAALATADTQLSAGALASATTIPEPTVRKIMKRLAASDLAVSTRGASGGYLIHEATRDRDLASLVEVFEGPIALTTCCEPQSNDCDLESDCDTADIWRAINQILRDTLASLSLRDVTASHPSARSELVQLNPKASTSEKRNAR